VSKFQVLEKTCLRKGVKRSEATSIRALHFKDKKSCAECRVSNSREGFVYANVSYSLEKIANNRARVLRLPSARGTIALTAAPSKPATLPFACRPFLSLDAIFLDTRSLAYDVMQVEVLTRQKFGS
jgi:hypothetical protein